MKLVVIVFCLLCERYLIHGASFNRFSWFSNYFLLIDNHLNSTKASEFPWLVLVAVILPLVIITALVLWFFGSIVFGFLGLILQIIIFYSCLGPQNPFYPVSVKGEKAKRAYLQPGQYLADVNGQLFSVIFWYIVTGPLGIIIYRTVSLSVNFGQVSEQATLVRDIMDWVPARITAILYLLVGNFQKGKNSLVNYFGTHPAQNDVMLSECGIAAASSIENEEISISSAERLVEHALVISLVLLALFTIIAWL